MFQLTSERGWCWVLRLLHILVVLWTFSFSTAENHLTCFGWNERPFSFSELSEPIIGFTETVVINGVTYAGWYIVESDFAPLLPFKAWFEEAVYVDGLEIGERFETPRSQWPLRGFIDYVTMMEAFLDLSVHAPVCVFEQK
jgi:hypothetical protein